MQQVLAPDSDVARPIRLSPQLKGYAAIAMVVFIWSGFALTMRAISSSGLTTADVALIRFALPVFVFAPFSRRQWHEIRRIRWLDAMLILTAGVPFFYLAALGAKTAPAAFVGTVLAGTSPLFVAILAACFSRQKITKNRGFALLLILAGVFSMLFGQSGPLTQQMFNGLIFLLLGGLVWAAFTMSVKRSRLSPISVAIVMSGGSLAITLLLIMTGMVKSNIGVFSLHDAMPFILVQGLCVGVLATTGYSYAVSQLGSAKSSTFGSLSPALTALLAVPVFHESLTLFVVIGVSLAVLGVVLSNRS
ncbi:DMT family transporter [Reinekea marinisedimentorum]|uniref:EamA-like transporter family protein n=1 Tax=Reinekea marinisedimentorum TaxID=230495 RepID=A0A4R3IB77_9GAMM|nr:DMT family transporter [Reinekea marinisedimentorum]TCS42511.1 EamA-like transporter family protein [Reinekea marinisedimentorum]